MDDGETGVGECYCRFAKRDLDGMSWLAPVFNNRFGDLLNLELRHEHLFFVEGERVVDNVGYSEKGTRFNEADFGKPIETLEAMERQGYWFVGRKYDPAIMREALDQQDDGEYYSVFSNQCQDWTDRLRRRAERIERERGVRAGGRVARQKPVKPTEPASMGFGVLAMLLGAIAIAAPYLIGEWFMLLMGMVFVVSGVSHFLYAMRGWDTRDGMPIVLFGLFSLLAGVFVLVDSRLAVVGGSLVIAGYFLFEGVVKTAAGIFSRPRINWTGTLAHGLVLLVLAAVFFIRWPDSSRHWLGLLVGIGLVTGGISTIALSVRSRNEKA